MNSPELPRLSNGGIGGGGTKSQASTASSSATRDSGISLTDAQRLTEEAFLSSQNGKKASYNRMISVNELPVNGHAVNLSNRGGGGGSTTTASLNNTRPNTNVSDIEVIKHLSYLAQSIVDVFHFAI